MNFINHQINKFTKSLGRSKKFRMNPNSKFRNKKDSDKNNSKDIFCIKKYNEKILNDILKIELYSDEEGKNN